MRPGGLQAIARAGLLAGLAFVMCAASAGGAAPALPLRIDGRAPAFSGPAVVILWATWCANCAAELKRLPSLISAARPLPVVTLAIDPPERARRAMQQAGLDTRKAFADPGEPATVLARWGGTALPLAVAIDAHGEVCGRKRGLLGSDQLRQWAKACLN